MKKRNCVIACALVALSTAGCDPASWLKKQTEPEAPATPSAPSAAESAATPTPSPTPRATRNAKANAELLREMHVVIFQQEPKNPGEFGNLVDSMNQGASLEGVYNGLTHSAIYRELEAANPTSSKQAIAYFAEELALLEQELSRPTEFGEGAARPLATSSDEPDPNGVQELKFSKKGASPSAGSTIEAGRYAKLFAGASIYTLKRVLGEEALKVIQEKKAKGELSSWYAKWAARLAGRKVDFGIPQRNKADEQFHRHWADSVDEDALRWEVLNRLHRLANEANKGKS